jgi:hypothetical protein
MTGLNRCFRNFAATNLAHSNLPTANPQDLVDILLITLMLVACNDVEDGDCGVFSEGLLATIEPQQAVAKSFVGRRVTFSTCLFFSFNTALSAFTSLRDVSLRCNGFAVVTSDAAHYKTT